MKNRIASVLLLACLLLGNLPPCAAASPKQEDATIPLSVLEHSLRYMPDEPTVPEEITPLPKQACRAMRAMPESRNNLFVPAPLMEDCYRYAPDVALPIFGIAVNYFERTQLACLAVYPEENFDAEPLYTGMDYFSKSEEMYAYEHVWYTMGQVPEGEYTIVCFIAEATPDGYQAVDGTGYSVTLHLVSYQLETTGYAISDYETGQPITELNTVPTQTSLLRLKQQPYNSTESVRGGVRISSDIVRVESYYGLLVIEPIETGWAELEICTAFQKKQWLPISICIDTAGHQEAQPITLREPSLNNLGVELHSCEKCGKTYYEKSKNFNELVDVPPKAWYFEEVRKAVCTGLFNGYSAHHFCPLYTMNRAMLVTALWRYAGQPESGAPAFADVPEASYYAKAVAWAAKNEIVNGVGNNRFDPNGTVTREQLATILYRYATMCRLATEAEGALTGFADGGLVGAWANDAMRWAVAEKIIGGSEMDGKQYLLPKDGATRAEATAIFVRTIDSVLNPPPAITLPDTATAARFGYINAEKTMLWAFYPDGRLEIGGEGWMPAYSSEDYARNPLPWEAFRDYITSVNLRYGIQNVGEAAFSGCKNLRSVTLPQGLYSIGDLAFSDCTTLEEIAIPEGVLYIGSYAFAGCSSLKSVELPDSFFWESMERSGYLFKGCTALTSVKLPVGLQSLTDGFFQDCTGLKTLTLPFVMENLSHLSLANCSALEELTLPMNVSKLADTAISGTTCLKKLTILNPKLTVYSGTTYTELPEHLNPPFGAFNTTVVVGYSGSSAQYYATLFGYQFSAIS